MVEANPTPHLRQRVLDVCRAALKEGRPIRCDPSWKRALDWLVEHDLAARTARGQMVLLSKCLRSVTKLRGPEILKEPRNQDNSLWGLRSKLQRTGWRPGGKNAKAVDMTFNQNNTSKTYCCLLLECYLEGLALTCCFPVSIYSIQ